MFNYNNPHVTTTGYLASIATNGSADTPEISWGQAAQVIGARFIASSSQPSATTTGSGLTVTLYKNASNAGSIVASFNTSGTAVAANGSVALTLTTVAANTKFAANDVLIAEITGGAAMGSTLNSKVAVDYIFGYDD